MFLHFILGKKSVGQTLSNMTSNPSWLNGNAGMGMYKMKVVLHLKLVIGINWQAADVSKNLMSVDVTDSTGQYFPGKTTIRQACPIAFIDIRLTNGN